MVTFDRRAFLAGAGVAAGVLGLAYPETLGAAPFSPALQGRPRLVINGLDPSVLSEPYVQMQRSAGVDCWHITLDGLGSFAATWGFVDRHPDLVRVVTTVKEIEEAKREGKLGLLLGWQSALRLSGLRDGPNDWWSDPPRSELRAYYQLGLRISGIAYQIANAFGGGGLDGHIGLSRAGRRLVEEIHELKIILDVGGHTGDQTSLDAIAISAGVPVICSHGNTRALANSSRNLSDQLIEAIAKTGGVIGVVAISDFVMRGKEMAQVEPSPLGTVDDMIRHADHIKKLVGAPHVGLGPDFTHGMSLTRDYALFGPDVMDQGPRRYVKGFESITELPNVINALERHGWTGAEIDGFLGANWARVYRRVWGA